MAELLHNPMGEKFGLNDARFLQNCVGTVFVDSLDGSSREYKVEGLFEFRNVNTLLLKIGVFSNHAGWVKLGSTSTVGVASTHL